MYTVYSRLRVILTVAVQAEVQSGGEDQDYREQLHGGGWSDARRGGH